MLEIQCCVRSLWRRLRGFVLLLGASARRQFVEAAARQAALPRRRYRRRGDFEQ